MHTLNSLYLNLFHLIHTTCTGFRGTDYIAQTTKQTTYHRPHTKTPFILAHNCPFGSPINLLLIDLRSFKGGFTLPNCRPMSGALTYLCSLSLSLYTWGDGLLTSDTLLCCIKDAISRQTGVCLSGTTLYKRPLCDMWL